MNLNNEMIAVDIQQTLLEKDVVPAIQAALNNTRTASLKTWSTEELIASLMNLSTSAQPSMAKPKADEEDDLDDEVDAGEEDDFEEEDFEELDEDFEEFDLPKSKKSGGKKSEDDDDFETDEDMSEVDPFAGDEDDDDDF